MVVLFVLFLGDQFEEWFIRGMNHPKDGVGQVAVALKEPCLLGVGVELGPRDTGTFHDVHQDPLALRGIENLLVVVV
jgi:hypothetical protein